MSIWHLGMTIGFHEGTGGPTKEASHLQISGRPSRSGSGVSSTLPGGNIRIFTDTTPTLGIYFLCHDVLCVVALGGYTPVVDLSIGAWYSSTIVRPYESIIVRDDVITSILCCNTIAQTIHTGRNRAAEFLPQEDGPCEGLAYRFNRRGCSSEADGNHHVEEMLVGASTANGLAQEA